MPPDAQAGNGPGNEMHQIWLEPGALQGKQMRHFDVFNIVRGRDGRKVYFYSDPDRLEAHLNELAPQDSRLIHDFCQGLRPFRKCLKVYPFLKPVGLMGRLEPWRMKASFIPTSCHPQVDHRADDRLQRPLQGTAAARGPSRRAIGGWAGRSATTPRSSRSWSSRTRPWACDAQAAELPGIRHPSINVQFRSHHYPELSPQGGAIV